MNWDENDREGVQTTALQVEILDVFGGFSHVRKENGELGTVPSYFLELVDIPGDTLAEQIRYVFTWQLIAVSQRHNDTKPMKYYRMPLLQFLLFFSLPFRTETLFSKKWWANLSFHCEGEEFVYETLLPIPSSTSDCLATVECGTLWLMRSYQPTIRCVR